MVSKFYVRLFGRFAIKLNNDRNLDVKKAIELFCYLLVFRDRPHYRETLAEMIWSDNLNDQSKKYLRQALWQIQSVLEANHEQNLVPLLIVEPEWIQINPKADFWLDIAEFEQAYSLIQGRRGEELDPSSYETLKSAVELYRGDFMEGWYTDWCLFERERFQNMYFMILDKLMGYCETHLKYEEGLTFGEQILRYDIARERTHRRMARFYYLLGERTAALRQYELCVTALNEQLGVKPSQRTVEVFEQIRFDHLNSPHIPNNVDPTQAPSVIKIQSEINVIRTSLDHFHSDMIDQIKEIENLLAVIEQ